MSLKTAIVSLVVLVNDARISWVLSVELKVKVEKINGRLE